MALSQKRSRFFSPRRSSLSQSESSSHTEQPLPILTPIPTAPLQAPRASAATEQAAELLKITNHIRTQLHEVQRLRQLKAPLLDTAESNWIDATVSDIADAAHDVAVLLEPTRVEQEIRNGKLSLGRQLRWKYRDSQRAIHKSHRLLACHHSLMGVLSHLQRVDSSQSTPSRLYELDTEGTSSASLEGKGLAFIPAEPVRERIVVSNVTKLDSVVDKPTEKITVDSGVVDCEMDDLLAWRRSRRAVAVTKQSVIHVSRESDTGV
ncbi:hypothetical protein BBP40_002329 [Aspergillus hancockii]|nr:hypothetical protein BBP40_002329 [Aspergillus hancockii]